MRDYIFRGKRVCGDQWIEGSLWVIDGVPQIYTRFTEEYKYFTVSAPIGGFWHLVRPESVGQYTGMKDKHGRKIFEGDIVDCWSEGVNAQGTVQQRKDGLWIIYPAWQKHIMWGLCPDEYSNTTVEVIGNEFDNADLLEG